MTPPGQNELPLFDDPVAAKAAPVHDQGRQAEDRQASAATTAGRPRALIAFGLALLLAAVGFAGARSYRDLAMAKQRIEEIEQLTTGAESRINDLEQRLIQLEGDPLTLERLAREQLGMAAPDDILIVLPQAQRR